MAQKYRPGKGDPTDAPAPNPASQYSLEKTPLSTGQKAPRVNPAVRAAMSLKDWYVHRRAAGMVALILIALLLVLAAWFGKATYELLSNYLDSWWD